MKPRPIKPSVINTPMGKYHAAVLKVVGKDPDGQPRTFELVREDEETQLSADPASPSQFWIVYAPRALSERKRGGDA